jgi:hypothetical protein
MRVREAINREGEITFAFVLFIRRLSFQQLCYHGKSHQLIRGDGDEFHR